MESEEDIQRKFDKLFAEALTSPLPKLKFHRPIKKDNKSPKVTSSSKPSTSKEKEVAHGNQSVQQSLSRVQPAAPVQQLPKDAAPDFSEFPYPPEQQEEDADEDAEDDIPGGDDEDAALPDNYNKHKEIPDLSELPAHRPHQLPTSQPHDDADEDDKEDADEDDILLSGQVSGLRQDEEDEVSSLVNEEEEFFMHKPRPTRDNLRTEVRRLNLDGLWSKIIIHKTPARWKDCSNEDHQAVLLQRNLRRCQYFFKEYLSQMKLLQNDQDMSNKNAKVGTNRRGQKRKSVGEVEISKASKLKKPMITQRNNTKNDAKSNAAGKPKKPVSRSKKTPNRKMTSKTSELKRPCGRPRKNGTSQPPSRRKTVKESSSKKTRGASNHDEDDVIFIDTDDTESGMSDSKSRSRNRPSTGRKSSNAEKSHTGLVDGVKQSQVNKRQVGKATRVPKVNPAKEAQKSSARNPKVAVCQPNTNRRNTTGASKAKPYALSRLVSPVKATGVAIDLPPVAMNDPLVAASMREDWGAGIRPLFSSFGGRTHCGGVWKAIVDEDEV